MHLWLYTGDGGPDQNKFKRVCQTTLLRRVDHLFIGFPCILHGGALITKNGIQIVESWIADNNLPFKFFASIAKIVYVWRDGISSVLRAWCRLHGAESALMFTRSLPLVAISGRWGSISASLKRMIVCVAQPRSTFKAVLPITAEERDSVGAGVAGISNVYLSEQSLSGLKVARVVVVSLVSFVCWCSSCSRVIWGGQ